MGLNAARTAYAARASAPFTIFCQGDSVTEGQAATVTTPVGSTRWVDIMRIALQAHNLGGIAGGTGGIGTAAQSTVTQWWTYSSGSSPAPVARWPGSRGASFSATQSATIVLPAGTSVDVCYWQGTGTSSFTVTINGTPTTVTPAGGTLTNIGKTNVSAGMTTGGNNTVVVTANAAATSYIDGLIHYNGDETAGIRTIEAGHWGWTVGNYVTDIDTNNGATGYPARAAQLAPKLYVVAFGLNDYSAQVAIATWIANMNALISRDRGWTAGASFLLVSPYLRTDVISPTIPLSSYRDALAGIAAADPQNISFVDMAPVFAAGGAGLLQPDGVHPTDAGMALFGATVAQAILANVGGGLFEVF